MICHMCGCAVEADYDPDELPICDECFHIFVEDG